LTSILINPAEVVQVRDAGWSADAPPRPRDGERSVGTADGLGFGVDDSWHNPVEVVRWSELEAIARQCPTRFANSSSSSRERWRQHQSAYPRFTASAAAVGCGPIMAGEPLTARQEAYVREHEAFEASEVLPAWETTASGAGCRAASPSRSGRGLSAGADAGELLELLDDQQLDQQLDRDTNPVDSSSAGSTGTEVRACAQDEHGHVTPTDVPDGEAEFLREAAYHRESIRSAHKATALDAPSRGVWGR
jgi:hypothetical protein